VRGIVVSDDAEQFGDVQLLYARAVLLTEGGKPVILLPAFRFTDAGDQPQQMDLLLVPFAHSGYVTRLFFESQIAGRGSNWKQHRVVERNWWAPSWNQVPATMPWRQMLLAHLRAVA
jgi:hypothetical protein